MKEKGTFDEWASVVRDVKVVRRTEKRGIKKGSNRRNCAKYEI
jgi:hypothetical protein